MERNAAFWETVASHPSVSATLAGHSPRVVSRVCRSSRVFPLAAAHGGYIFVRLDAGGFCCELHSLFTPEGWGREALLAGVEALGAIWRLGFHLVITLETSSNSRSRPPLSFGFRPAGEYRGSRLGSARQWSLSRRDWEASPVKRRHSCP